MPMRRPLLLLTMALSVSVGTLVQGADDFVLSRFTDYLESLRNQAGIPGLAAEIVGPSNRLWEGYFGQADVERNFPPLRFDTPFHLDDTTQTIAASLVLRCASDGLLSLDDPVGKFAPSSPDAGATLRQLLTHTTPGPNGLNFSYRPERLAPVAAAIASCKGTTFRSAVAAFLEQKLMFDSVPGSDVVSVTPPAEGFTATTLQRYSDLLVRLATPYAVEGRGRATRSSYVASTLTPASGLISSLRDLEQFDLALKRGDVLPPEWLALAWTPPNDATGRPLPHAYGWFVQAYNGERIVWHFGVSDNASSSMIISVPRRGLTLILLANSAGLARSLALSAGDVTVSPFARLFLSIFLR
jgi:CubicO group peptidase (beta-lactamase class C family)